ncbi:MAG: HAD-IA family hydrolase [Myxococcota bacterium]|nr:HAD-IA family hydrolase [Myxococcota bacterium]
MRIRAVILDLDGTLVDTLGGITAALAEALADCGLRPVPAERVREIVGDGPRSLCLRAMGGNADDEAVERVLRRFRERYAASPLRGSSPYPGVPAVLDRLAPRPLGLCTNKGRRVAELVADAFGIAERVSAMLAEDDLPARKPDPRPILHLAASLGAAPAATLVVGDGPQDILAARNAGALSCAVLQGYGDHAALAAAGPTWTIPAIADLPDLVERIG